MKIYVFGLGAIGSNLTTQLMNLFPDATFVGIDFDDVETRNIKTQAYFVMHVGQKKSNALRAVLQTKHRRPGFIGLSTKIETVEEIKTMLNEHKDCLVLDCFDNTASRKLILEAAGDTPCLHIGFSPTYTAEILWNENYSVPDDIDPALGDICTQDDAGAFISFVVSLAAMTVKEFVSKQEKNNYIITHKHTITKL